MSIFFAGRLDTSTSGIQRRRDKAIGPYDYIRCGESSKKFGCSIRSAWVGAGSAFDKSGTIKFEGKSKPKREWMGIISVFIWGLGFPVMSRRFARRVSS